MNGCNWTPPKGTPPDPPPIQSEGKVYIGSPPTISRTEADMQHEIEIETIRAAAAVVSRHSLESLSQNVKTVDKGRKVLSKYFDRILQDENTIAIDVIFDPDPPGVELED